MKRWHIGKIITISVNGSFLRWGFKGVRVERSESEVVFLGSIAEIAPLLNSV
jgi:hypothetical protein